MLMKKQFAFLTAVILLACGCMCSAGSEGNQTENALPARYDMRDDGIVTPVKLQYPWMCCWGFGAIAAAETSILSAMGKTYGEFPLDMSERHAVWFAHNPAEPVKSSENSGQDETMNLPRLQMRIFGGDDPSRVGALFATGAGPVEESVYPYHGREATPEAYVAMKEPERWIENYIRINTRPEMEEEEVRELEEEAERQLKKKQAEIETGYNLLWFSGDDWTIPETDENGRSARMQRSRWLLKDDNRLPPLVVPSDPEDEDSVCVPNEAGILAAKQEMLNGHGVIAIYLAERFSPAGENPDRLTNYENWAQYSYEQMGGNHAICIVGWDDNFPAEAFTHEVHGTDEKGNRTVDAERTKKTTPPGNGAWLIKNSRGSETDAIPDGMTAEDGSRYPENRNNYGIVNEDGLHTGYNWISYYDQYLCSPETLTFTVEPEEERTGILQYDFMTAPFGSYFEQQSGQPVSCANVFTADRDMTLTGVSVRTVHDNSRVTFQIVKLKENSENPEDGEEIGRFSVRFRYFGYHRTTLDTPVELKKGDRFSVITTTDYLEPAGTRVWEYSAMTDKEEEGADPMAANPGESFVKENGKWQDWTEKEKPAEESGMEMLPGEEPLITVYDNFSIKAFFTP